MILLIWTHFVADFILQSDKMALNKSHSNFWLLMHGLAYGLPFLLVSLSLPYALVNALAHVIVDYFTSRLTLKLWTAGKRHWFFVVIGFDQAVHLTVLYLTLGLL